MVPCFLGINPSKEKLLRQHIPPHFCITFNITPFQDKKSNTCALFIIFFVYNKFFNPEIELQELSQTSFSKHTRRHETKVHKFYKNGQQGNTIGISY